MGSERMWPCHRWHVISTIISTGTVRSRLTNKLRTVSTVRCHHNFDSWYVVIMIALVYEWETRRKTYGTKAGHGNEVVTVRRNQTWTTFLCVRSWIDVAKTKCRTDRKRKGEKSEKIKNENASAARECTRPVPPTFMNEELVSGASS